MASTLRKLRIGVIAGAVLLLAAVTGFMWYGHFAMRRFWTKLPKQLGVDIRQETNGFTYSQSVKGRTVFTVHAAKEVQRNNGVITLQDVGIELYGRQDGKTDRIHGNEFEFDQAHGTIRAVGDVYIDLAAPDAKNGKGAADDTSRMIHLKTSGLVIDQNAKRATTEERIEFAADGLQGAAEGAEYDAGTGVVVLRSAIQMSGERDGRPLILSATRAELDRQQNVSRLSGARYVSLGLSLSADRALVRMSADEAPQELEAEGHVVLAEDGRAQMTGERLEMALNAAGQPRLGHLCGTVRYRSSSGSDQGPRADAKQSATENAGQADDVRVSFDERGRPLHAVVTGGVQMDEGGGGDSRSLRAKKVELTLSEEVKGKVLVKMAEAAGDASLRMQSVGAKGRTATDVNGDALQARFVAAGGRQGGKERIEALVGTGHTTLYQRGADGAEERSNGDTLELSFRAGEKGSSEIERAVQRGGVRIVRVVPGKAAAGRGAGGPTSDHATADMAVYEADEDRLTLSGGVQVADVTNVLEADRVSILRKNGDASANGNVRVSYAQGDGRGEPLHVIAERAVERQESGIADFWGSSGANARMWQGQSQVDGPLLHFDQAKRQMVASGAAGGEFVHAVLVSMASVEPTKKGGKGAQAVRIVARKMTYAETARQVEFEGAVKVEDRDGTLHANEATVLLSAPGTKGPAGEARMGMFAGGQVERMIANGSVEVEQAGRSATGEHLVYTAKDGTFVLTGSKGAMPRMVDEVRGTITGASLRFRTGDNSVVISGGSANDSGAIAAGQRVRSETRVRQ